MKKRVGKTKKIIGSSEIFLLVLSTFAIAFIIGQTEKVSAADTWYVTSKNNYQIVQSSSGLAPSEILWSGSDLGKASSIQSGLQNGEPLSSVLNRIDPPATGSAGDVPNAQASSGSGVGSLASALPIASATSSLPKQGELFMNVKFGDTTKVVRWDGYVDGSDTLARGTLADGTKVQWDRVDNYQVAEVSKVAQSNWAKTFELGGQKYAIADAAQNPSSVPGLLDSSGKLTEEGSAALSKEGFKNAYIDSSGALASSTQAPYQYSGFFGLAETGNFLWGNLFQGLEWSIAVVGVIQLLRLIPGVSSQLVNSLSVAAFAGIMGGKAAYGLFGKGVIGQPGGQGYLGNFISPAGGILIGVGIAAVVFVLMYKKESKKVVNLQCLPWEAPLGGSSCEKCNQDPLKPCSEYRCKSLGQACELVNKGTTDERCVWVNPKDVTSPTITPWKEVLTSGLDYRPDGVRPPALGSKIVRNDGGCITPYTPLTFGIVTNEPAQCKIDYNHINKTKAFDSMQFFFGETNFYSYNHTESLRLPSAEAVQNASDGSPELKNGALTNLFVRCRDANGNENVDDYVFTFCVDKSPDTTAPVIESTSITSGSPVTAGVQNISLYSYVNEPSECKWSAQDKNYQDMENTFSCATQVYQQNAQQLYPCTTTLTGLKDNADNTFFFRCKDQPFKADKDRNVNSQSYKFVLRGSQALSIVNSGPNGTITGSTDVVPVDLTLETDDGSDNGKAICYFSNTGAEDSFVAMFETNNYKHKQTLNLASGNYNYYFRCVDSGGNADAANVSFNVFLDRQAPKVTRVYKEGADALKLVTDEDAECTYSMQNCNFNFADGKAMIYNTPGIKTALYAPWQDGSTYYIKCRDGYGNLPSPNSCSIVAGAANLH